MKIIKPTLLIDEVKCRANIRAMAEKAKRNQVVFRPHFKTHQSLEIGEWFREEGVEHIAVSSVDMATYFANGAWKDITIAIPVNILDIEAINALAARITLNLVLESEASCSYLAKHLKSPVNIFIKVDMGYHRTGIAIEDTERLDKLSASITASPLLTFKGFLAHAGNSYQARSEIEITKVHEVSIKKLRMLRKFFHRKYPDLIFSIGDTPTCSVMEDFTAVDEIRAGNFAFYDLMQVQIGACKMEEIAVCMACPVIAIHKDRKEVIIYGGGVHFSKDRIEAVDGKIIWGRVVTDHGTGWGPVLEQVYLKKLSQEHGTISAPLEYIEQIKIGDIIKVLPVHSCMTVDCMKGYQTIEDGREVSKL